MPAEGAVDAAARSAIVVAGGDQIPLGTLKGLPAPDLVIAADSGLDHALALGLAVDVVVGDLDSVSPEALAAARDAGVTVDEHPAAKDQTDLELALDTALRAGSRRVFVVGGHGGRLDHLLANAFLLASPAYAAMRIEAHWGPARVYVVRDEVAVDAVAGDLVTLLPVGGAAEGVETEGLLYPLRGEPLLPGSTRGVSNVFVGDSARIRLRGGVLLAVLPGGG
jgi:thiamine pyrophosphokinase